MMFTLGTPLDQIDAGVFTVARSRYAPDQMLTAHTHEHASVNIVFRGAVIERVGGRRFECTPDNILVRPAAEIHENRYGCIGAECLCIGADPDWVEDDEVARGVFAAPTTTTARGLNEIARRMRDELRAGDRAAMLAIEGLSLELVAVAARQVSQPRGRTAPHWLRAIRDRLVDEGDTPRLNVLARETGVHAVYLSRAFRRWFGCSPGEFVRQRRIEQACAELAHSHRSIAEIAVDAGFASPSHFATAFRRVTGMTPTEYRAARGA